MKNVLIIRSNINAGGPASLIRATVEELIKREYGVYIACGGGNAIQGAIDAGAHLEVFEELSFSKRSVFGSIIVIPKIRRYIINNSIDTIYGMNSAASLVAYFAIIGMHKKIKVGNALLGMRKESLHKLMPFKHACMSNAQKEYLVKCGMKAENITTIYPSTLDLRRFDCNEYDRDEIRNALGVPSKSVLIGSVMNGKKGRKDFPDLIKKVCDANDNVYWAFVGNTDKYEIYKNTLKNTAYENKCLFLGLRSDIPELMYAFDILSHYVLLESDNMETFGMVLTEAMSMETPVVTNNYGGMVEIVVDGVTGFLVNDDSGYLKAINELCNDNELRVKMSFKAKDRAVDLFSKEKYGDNLEGFLKSL